MRTTTAKPQLSISRYATRAAVQEQVDKEGHVRPRAWMPAWKGCNFEESKSPGGWPTSIATRSVAILIRRDVPRPFPKAGSRRSPRGATVGNILPRGNTAGILIVANHFVLSGLSDEQLEILATSPWLGDLKSLELSETCVTDDGVERLARSPAWQGLEDLGIDRNRLTERSVQAILGAGWFPRLKSLNLHASCTIGDAGGSAGRVPSSDTAAQVDPEHGRPGRCGCPGPPRARYAPQLWTLWLVGNEAISPSTMRAFEESTRGRRSIPRSQ